MRSTSELTNLVSLNGALPELAEQQPEDSVPESRVLIIMTGGTICMRQSPSGFVPARGFQEQCLARVPTFNDGSHPSLMDVVVNADKEVKGHPSLRTPVTAYGRRVRYTVFEFEELLDSSSIDAKGWAEIARTIERNYTRFDGFVVLHGTDSLAYTCSALSFMLQNLGKPVVLTGAQAPMLELQNDATDNLLGSLVVAGHFMIPEVCLYFNNRLFRGNRSCKVAASDFAAFNSPNCPPLAVTTSMRTNVDWELVNRPKSLDHFSIQTNLDTTHVACLRIFPGIKPEMVDAVLKLDGLRGLVLETFGAGNAPSGQDNAMTNVLADAIKRGIVIVNVTQCLTGSVSPVYAPGMSLSRAGVVAGLDLTTEAALTKLAYLLALPDSTPEWVAKNMSVSLRGELTEVSQPVFRHPDGALPERVQSLTVLGYAIAQGDIDRVKEIVAREHHWLLNDADYSGNTPIHLAATSPSVEILRYLLLQGGSVHIRNRNGRTPLFLAANAGLSEHVLLLRKSGGHLHSDERTAAQLLARRRPAVWGLAGIGPREVSDRELEEIDDEGTSLGRTAEILMAGSAP
ncbi:lysophospholipase [Aspergillus indologenus CBS 114.80]|uniref:asparaginase n=1 Tax=Aspergillus indologenus CBS 114.80 TaxID=1450541 RepID=A0A2V5JBT0_9EURO|nr:lysophospholipase [Aspergillus indologenus CBS 114.80]